MSRFTSLTLVLFSVIMGKSYDDSVIYPAFHDQVHHAQDVSATHRRVEITTSLLQSDVYLSFIESPADNRRLAKRALPQIGDTLTFSVRNIFDQTKWNRVHSELVFDTAGVAIWVETESMDSLLTEYELTTIIDEFTSYLFDKSGQYSVDSTLGILSIMTEYFGSPPDIDLDGKLDILLLDIRDTFAATGSYVAGFFDPNDLTNSATSNQRDLIYIDLYPSIKYEDEINDGRSVPTLAHEYQHLIHANYEGPEREYIFINEGLSEIAEIVCGFTPRSPLDHFNSPVRPLLSWNAAQPLPDYARASLWTHYLFEQIGFENISDLVQSSMTGVSDYQQLVNQHSEFTLDELFVNWSIANLVNQSDLDLKYRYLHPARQNIARVPQRIENFLPAIGSISLGRYASFPVDVPLVNRVKFQEQNSGNSISSIVRYPDGSVTVNPSHMISPEILMDPHRHGSVTFIVTNITNPGAEEDLNIFTSEYLITGRKSGIPNILSYDDGYSDVFYRNASYLLLEGKEAVAIRFEPGEMIWLESIAVKAIFLNEIAGTGISPNVPRDMRVRIVADNNGLPGDVLVDNFTHIFSRPLGNLKPEQISLNNYYQELSNLEQQFFVILQNDGDDSNYFAIGLDSLHETTETQFYFKQDEDINFSWSSFEDVAIGNSSLQGWNAMCRATVIPETQYLSGMNLNPSFRHDFASVNFSASIPFIIDTLESGVIVELPSGQNMDL
ncbi:MAG: hypothetical protein H8E18_09730, partial [FCB group bacterium]|nr:hypothetical protein [FCB group bacterium]